MQGGFMADTSGRWGPVALVLVIALVTGCSKHGSSTSGAPHQLKKSDLTVAEQKYGVAPVPDKSVTYQPDVIIVGGGAAAIREQSSNGFIWTIDARAPHADDLVPGKVFFMTNRAVGRVLEVHKSGSDLVVTVGPVDITEIVSEAHIHIVDMPINFGEALMYTAPDLPGQFAWDRPLREPSAVPAVLRRQSGWGLYRMQAAGPPVGGPPAANPNSVPDVSSLLAKNFKAVPFASEDGVGVHVTADGAGLTASAEAVIRLATPKLSVHLDITPFGGVTRASVELTGAAGLSWKFNVGTDVGLKGNVDGVLQPDVDFSIPVGGIGPVPLAVTVRQKFLIRTGFGVRNSTLSASGDYTFTGGFKVGYFNKKWSPPQGPANFTTNESLVQTGTGISIGLEGLNLADQMKVIVGVGAYGFAAGPYFSFTSAIGAFRNSDIGMIRCNGAILDIKLSGGVGYVIPKAVTNLINSFLSGLNISFRIKGEGGLEPGPAITVVDKSSSQGGCNVDKNPAAVGTVNGPV
jgi:hypothetical protein